MSSGKAHSAAAGGDRYDALEIFFHWATVILVVLLYLLAQAWGFLPHASDFRHGLESLHVSIGLVLTAVVVLRVVWILGPGRRVAPASSGLAQFATTLIQYALYGLLAAVIVLGLLNRWGHGDPLSFFGAFTIPSPYAFSKDQAHTFNEIHELVANSILALAGLHACAALAHHYVLKDGILRRMLPAGRA
jgi:cytochrome b561